MTVGLAILCIMILEVFAILHGINGKVFVTSIVLIAGLAGFRLGRWRTEQTEERENGTV